MDYSLKEGHWMILNKHREVGKCLCVVCLHPHVFGIMDYFLIIKQI